MLIEQLINCMDRNVVLELSDQFYKYLFGTLRCGRSDPQTDLKCQEYKTCFYFCNYCNNMFVATHHFKRLQYKLFVVMQGKDSQQTLHRSFFFCLIFFASESQHTMRTRISLRGFSILSFAFFSFASSISGSSLSRQHTHWPNARCRRDDTEMDRVLHSVSRARFLFRFALPFRVASD